MFKKIPLFLFFFGLFFMFNPFKNTYASTSAPSWYQQKKVDAISYIEYANTFKGGITVYNLFEISNHKDEIFTMVVDGDYVKFKLKNGNAMSGNHWSYTVENDVLTTGKSSPNGGILTNQYSLVIKSSVASGNQLSINPLTFKGIKWDIDLSGDLNPNTVFPPPPSMEDEGQFGYQFIYPKNDEIINLLNSGNSSYLKVPFKVKIKNYYPWSTKTVEDKFKVNFTINNYKTEINTFVWEKKTDILGLSDYGLFTVEGFYYLPVGNTSDTLQANVYMPTEPWLSSPINVTYTYDGSKPSYNPIDNTGETGGSIGDNGNVNIGGQDYGEIPQSPVDGDIGDWFAYIGSLLLWLVTYPFKLLGQIVSTLAGYITNMFNILTPVTVQLNSVLSFIPSDILNVCWGFLSFTVLYSVIKSVFKMIRG